MSAAKSFFARYGIIAVLLLILAVYAFEAHARRHFKPTFLSQGDQAAYLAYAQGMYESNYAFIGDRSRVPFYPFLLSLVYRPGLSVPEFLERAQAFNVNLSVLLLLLLFLFFRKVFPPLIAIAMLMTTAFGAFLYRAPWAQTEILFYSLTFCAFVLLVRMLSAPGWLLALLSGAITAGAYLAKASILPLIPLWAIVFLAQSFWQPRREFGHRLGMLLLVIGTFLIVVFPYIRTSKRLYGHYFYNVNSTSVMWCDSPAEAADFLHAYQRAPAPLSSEQVPSAARYWREHSVAQIVERLRHGLHHTATESAKPLGYYKFVIAFVFAGGILALRDRRRFLQLILRQPFVATFCFIFVGLYLLLFSWYEAVVSDPRFVLTTFLPFIFGMMVFLLQMDERRTFVRWFAGILIVLSLVDVAYNGFRAV